jgi:RNA polymerase sigma factor (sigma-70 family)
MRFSFSSTIDGHADPLFHPRALSFFPDRRPFLMDPKALLEANLDVVDRVVARVCARGNVIGADAEDFASEVRVALLADDGAILREWQGRASLATYLTVVVQRLLADARIRMYGKWHPSAEARRMGETAMTLERLVRRDGRTLDEALPHLNGVTRDEAAAMLERLPDRAPRARLVALDPDVDVHARRDAADERALASDARRLSERTNAVVRETMAAMTLEDRMILRFRFGSDMSVADISRMLRLPQRPLYRRIESLLATLRAALVRERIDARSVEELIGSPTQIMNFDLGKTADARPSMDSEAAP